MTYTGLYLWHPCTKDAPRSSLVSGRLCSGRAGSEAVCTLPPIRSRPSSTVTSMPILISARAELRPAGPAPMTTTLGVLPAHQDVSVSGRLTSISVPTFPTLASSRFAPFFAPFFAAMSSSVPGVGAWDCFDPLAFPFLSLAGSAAVFRFFAGGTLGEAVRCQAEDISRWRSHLSKSARISASSMRDISSASANALIWSSLVLVPFIFSSSPRQS
mmetsp:Transcript_13816/g.55960  ORF Transcript_13816/g.55960 Transcript_13816/m.55960 type:complete len:215 (+) Transcript_13816:3296-3940(+)